MVSQYNIFTQALDLSGKNVGVGISGGINSAAVLCWMADLPIERKPAKLGLIYIHMREHSDDTAAFSIALMRFARDNFDNVVTRIVRHSVLDFFEDERMIPHPKFSPCTHKLKLASIADFYIHENIDHDFIGFVRSEKRRIARQGKARQGKARLTKIYPIQDFDDDACIDVCMAKIGWIPAIYHIKNSKGKRIFSHNNCFPCKNMDPKDLRNVKKYLPRHYDRAMATANKLGLYWGRDKECGSCGVCEF